jgi:hypothetical protein
VALQPIPPSGGGGRPRVVRVIGRALAATGPTLWGLLRGPTLVTVPAALLAAGILGFVVPAWFGVPAPEGNFEPVVRTVLGILGAGVFLLGGIFFWQLAQAPLRIELEELRKPRLGFFVKDPDRPPFRDDDPMGNVQAVFRVGVRVTGLVPVHEIEVRIEDWVSVDPAQPLPPYSGPEPLEIMRGAGVFSRARPGAPIYAQVALVCHASDGKVPEVRVSYSHPAMGDKLHPPLPDGIWDLHLVATGQETTGPAKARCRLWVRREVDPYKRVSLKLLDDARS